MKTMTCNQLGGACEMKFTADTFDEIAEMSKKHGTEMFHAGDEAHLKAMGDMKQMMKSPDAIAAWFNNRRKEFESLPENK